jgi:hypothetical protein
LVGSAVADSTEFQIESRKICLLILTASAGFVTFLITALLAFFVAMLIAFFLGLLISLSVPFGVSSIIRVGWR